MKTLEQIRGLVDQDPAFVKMSSHINSLPLSNNNKFGMIFDIKELMTKWYLIGHKEVLEATNELISR